MKPLPRLFRHGLVAVTFGGLAGAAWTQSPEATDEGEVRIEVAPSAKRVRSDGVGTSESRRGRRLEVVVDAGVNRGAWQARLEDDDIDTRELAFDELIARASRDDELRLALEAWSLDPSMPDFAWTARLALRELGDREPASKLRWVYVGRSSGLPTAHSFDPRAQVEVEEPTTEGLRIRMDGAQAHRPSGSEVQDSPAELLRRIEFDPAQPLGDRSLPMLFGKWLSLYAPRPLRLPQETERHSFRLEFHPEGVVLTELIQRSGQTRQRSYAAESSQALLEAHPQLRNQVPGLAGLLAKPFGAGSQFEWGQKQFRSGNAGLGYVVRNPLVMPTTPANGATTRVVLGVVCTPLERDTAASSLLGPGIGLLIERREPGTVAEDLGLQRGDILIELAGEPLCSVEEISHVLERLTDEEIVVKILDRSLIERKLTWSPADPR